MRHLSGGQARRFSVVAALVNDPEVVFLDETTTGLDPAARRVVWDVIRQINREEGKTVVLTTHYMEEAELLADRVAIIDEGRIQAIDTPEALIARLDGVSKIRFATDRAVAVDELERLPGVEHAAETRASGVEGAGAARRAAQRHRRRRWIGAAALYASDRFAPSIDARRGSSSSAAHPATSRPPASSSSWPTRPLAASAS